MRKKRKPIERDELMAKTRAAVGYLNGHNSRGADADKETEIRAFLSIFHPELGQDKIREIARGAAAHDNAG